MNIIEAEDMVKGLPDQLLFQEAQFPSGRIPQYLAVSEVQRRQDMRQRFQAQQQGQQPTIKDQILQGGASSGEGQPPQMAPPMAPPGAAPPGAPMQQPMTGAPMGGMSRGGITRMAGGGITPGGIVYMQQGRKVPTDPAAAMFDSMLTRIPQAFSGIRDIMPAPAGVSMSQLEKFRPTREQYLDPEAERRRAELLTRLEQMGETRKAEDIAAAERYLKEAEAPIQEARDEARQAAISSTLMRLGAGLAAGRPEEGLASAAQGVEQTMGRARELAAAERRAARQDFRSAEREAVRGQRAMADQAFAMQAQNITSDENKQREFVRDQNQFAQFAFSQLREAGRDQQQAFNTAMQLSVGLTQAVDQAVREATREQNLNDRQYASTFGSVFKEVLSEVKNTDFGTDENGNPVIPTPEKLIDTARLRTEEVLSSAGISPAGGASSISSFERTDDTSVNVNGQVIRFKTKEQADAFSKSIGR